MIGLPVPLSSAATERLGCDRAGRATTGKQGVTGAETMPAADETARAMSTMAAMVNDDGALVERGRFVSGAVLLRVGATPYRLDFNKGWLTVAEGPFVMPSVVFSLSAPAEDWALFWRPVPPPGSNDIMALLKRRALTLDGALRLLMTNLSYFKDVLAKPRRRAA